MRADFIEGEDVNVTMTRTEASVLFNALTIAKIHVGEDPILGERGKSVHLDVERMRTELGTVADLD